MLEASLRLAWSGVDLFFVLSGFLIGGILIDNRESVSFFKTFYVRRVLRIFPLYFISIILFATIVSMNVTGYGQGFEWLFADPLPLWSYATFTQNIVMAVESNFGPYWIGVSWSLAIEEQFYLLLPLLIRITPPRHLAGIVLGCILIAPILRIIAYYTLGNLGGFFLFPCRMDALFLGVLGAWVLRSPYWSGRLRDSRRALQFLTVFLGVGILQFMLLNAGIMSRLMNTIGFTWIALFYLCVVLLAVDARSRWWQSLLSCMPLRAMGLGCFSLYLFHQPVIGVISALWHGSEPRLGDSTDLLVLTTSIVTLLGVAWLCWIAVERPCIRFGHRWRY